MLDKTGKPMPCGGIPIFDTRSGCGYICDDCMAVVGSIGMPDDCYIAFYADTKKGAEAPNSEQAN